MCFLIPFCLLQNTHYFYTWDQKHYTSLFKGCVIVVVVALVVVVVVVVVFFFFMLTPF